MQSSSMLSLDWRTWRHFVVVIRRILSYLLITALARDKQYGTVYNEDGTQLLDMGGPPLLLEPVQATISLKGQPVSSVKAVDVYGVPTDRELDRTGNTFRIDGRYATYYYEVVR